MTQKISIKEVNKLSIAEFEHLFKNVIELWPQAAALIASKRPFSNVNALVAHFDNYLDNIDALTKIKILQSHPDLAGKLLDENKLSDESANEQAAAGLNKLQTEQKSLLLQSNDDYRQKFDFPFVICVRQNNRIEKILEGFRQRLPNNTKTELNNGIEEVKKICEIRIGDIVE